MENELVTKHNFILYTSDNDEVKAKMILFDESLWMSQKMMAELFEVDVNTIGEHLANIFNSNELIENSTTRNFRLVQTEGLREVERDVKHYNLDAIIAVGYRINSKKATQFRIWSTKILKEFIVKGFVLDDERLKQGEKFFEKDYFRELLERIRSIRASERRIWLQITDIFQECSTDYLKDSDTAQTFFQTVQNKFHYAITGQTAAEIIYRNADATKPKMNLKTFKNSPNGRVLKSDSEVAKNYIELDSDIIVDDLGIEVANDWHIDNDNFNVDEPVEIKAKELMIKLTFKSKEELENCLVELSSIVDNYKCNVSVQGTDN